MSLVDGNRDNWFTSCSKGEAKGADDDPDRYLRLFVMVPKSATESDVKLHFSKFGDVQTVKLLRNKETKESKGIGYVTYSKYGAWDQCICNA